MTVPGSTLMLPSSSQMSAELADTFTSRGNKFFHHPAALEGLRNGKPRPVVTHLMLTDTCQHTCAFCSVATREGNHLIPETIIRYIEQLLPLGLKAVILSGGGNPILYKHKSQDYGDRDWDFNDVVDFLHGKGLEIGVITNGMPMVDYPPEDGCYTSDFTPKGRRSWKTVRPETLDKLTWVRISMSGLDHKEDEVFVPDIDKSKTVLGFSYVAHDIYEVPEEPNHGKVSTEDDLEAHGGRARSIAKFDDRIPKLTEQIRSIVETHRPRYIRLLPNCLQPSLIDHRCAQLQTMAEAIDSSVVFVQHKPPAAPPACYLGYLHPVLNSDGYVYPCDSCVLNKAAGHKFAEPWRMCHASEIGKIYEDRDPKEVKSLIKDPTKLCPGCVFTKSNTILTEIRHTSVPLPAPQPVDMHNFV